MIIISSEERESRHLSTGDTFNIVITRANGTRDYILSEEITRPMTIDYFCIFQFAEEDGTVVGANLAGFFGVEAELPRELQEAKRLHQLSHVQKVSFVHTSNLSCSLEAA